MAPHVHTSSVGGWQQQTVDPAREELARLKEEPTMVGTIVEVREKRMSVSFGLIGSYDVAKIEGAQVGYRVLCSRQTMQATELIKDRAPVGKVVTVKKVGKGYVEAEFEQATRTIACTIACKVGERVVIDGSDRYVIATLGMPPAPNAYAPKISVSWDDVGGQAEAKEALREAIELPLAHKELYGAYGKRGVKGVLLLGASGCGKCLGLGTPVLMHDGAVKKVEDVVTGDRLMGPDSRERLVTSLARGRAPMYRVTPVKGDAWTCNDAHILTLAGSGARAGETRDVSIKDYLAYAKSEQASWKLWRTGVEFSRADLFIDPYLAGIWLGDGGVNNFEITTMDQEVMDYCAAIAPAYGLVCRIYDEPSKAKRVKLVQENHRQKGTQGVTPNPLRDALKLFITDAREKYIPREYLIADHEQRMSLLAGLLDSDGHLRDGGGFEIMTKSIPLRDGILFLARSLGFAAYSTETQKSIKSIGFTGTYQRISLSGDLDTVPTRVAHKKASKRQQIKRVNVTGFTLEPIGEGDYYGFTLDGDRRFLLGDFTVTHNTLLAKAAATSIARAYGKAASEGFIYVKGPEILSKWIGETERQVRAFFEAAREHRAKHGYPALVFIDECDAVLGIRDRNANTNLNATVVPQFLAEMDGLDDSAAVFLLATNRADMLDPAVVREGRIDRKVRVSRPTAQDARQIFEIHLRGRPLAGSGHAERGVAELYADHRVIRRIDADTVIRMRDMASGAMVAGVVEQASTFALLRDVEERRHSATGISPENVVVAIDRAQKALEETDHSEVVREMLELHRRSTL